MRLPAQGIGDVDEFVVERQTVGALGGQLGHFVKGGAIGHGIVARQAGGPWRNRPARTRWSRRPRRWSPSRRRHRWCRASRPGSCPRNRRRRPGWPSSGFRRRRGWRRERPCRSGCRRTGHRRRCRGAGALRLAEVGEQAQEGAVAERLTGHGAGHAVPAVPGRGADIIGEAADLGGNIRARIVLDDRDRIPCGPDGVGGDVGMDLGVPAFIVSLTL